MAVDISDGMLDLAKMKIKNLEEGSDIESNSSAHYLNSHSL